jgi:hypothetical protein
VNKDYIQEIISVLDAFEDSPLLLNNKGVDNMAFLYFFLKKYYRECFSMNEAYPRLIDDIISEKYIEITKKKYDGRTFYESCISLCIEYRKKSITELEKEIDDKMSGCLRPHMNRDHLRDDIELAEYFLNRKKVS